MIAITRDGLNGLRVVLAGLAATIIGLLVWRGDAARNPDPVAALASYTRAPSPLAPSDPARPAIEHMLAQATAYAAVLDKMQREFPADYERLLLEFSDRARRDARIESADFYVSEMARGLRQRRGILAARAGPEPLARIFDLQAQMLKALSQTDPKLCVDFLYGNVSPGFYDFAGRNRTLVANMALAALDAVTDGRMQKIDRRAPSSLDFDLLEKELTNRGLSRMEIDALLDGRAPEEQVPEARMCQAGRLYIDALQSLPEDTRARIHALAVELMARS
ncbi:MAG: uncharacterized protein JWM36_2874 [Hyphomicrobiales bacterium]|nr:uncharacterized protein [Hyphomicrobiales bacterium]